MIVRRLSADHAGLSCESKRARFSRVCLCLTGVVARASSVSTVMCRYLLEDRVPGFSRKRTDLKALFAIRIFQFEGMVAMGLNQLGANSLLLLAVIFYYR